MSSPAPSSPAAPSDWLRILRHYRDPSHARSAFEVAITAGLFVLCWLASWAVLRWGYWLSLLVSIPAAGFLVRLFMIQHDCGHGTLFRHRRLNDWIGRTIGALTLTPYGHWRQSHNIHHASSGNLGRRGIGDIDTLTVREYLQRSPRQRLAYRIYRNPLVMFGLGPAYLFLVQHRLPVGAMLAGWRPWLSTMGTNAVIASVIICTAWFVGWWTFVIVHLPITLLAASIGVWLFYVQHQFEETFWAAEATSAMPEAALHGSSHYDLPTVLRWFTANIGIHHVHHLCSRIPYYRLTGVLRDYPELANVGRLTLRQSFQCVRLVLWDEDQRRLISFRELAHRGGHAEAV